MLESDSSPRSIDTQLSLRKRKRKKENRLKKEKREIPLLSEGKLIPSLVEQARISNKVLFDSPSPISFRVSIHFLLLLLLSFSPPRSSGRPTLIVTDVPLIAEVIFLSKGRHLRLEQRERERVHHRIFPSKDAGPLAFNADASFPLIPRDLSPTTIHSRPATFCSSRRRRRNRRRRNRRRRRSHLSPFVPRQDPVVAQKDYPSCSRGYSLRSKGLRVG